MFETIFFYIYQMLLIDSKNKIDSNKLYIEKFKKVYIEAFPDEMEREDFNEILYRVRYSDFSKTVIVLDIDGDDLSGGMVLDIYDNQIYHLIYLVTDPKFRVRGCAKKLIKEGLPRLFKNYQSASTGVFVETNIPHLTKKDSFSPKTRVEIFEKLGMKRIPIKYIQPPLEYGKNWVFNLQLLYCPVTSDLSEISTHEVVYFLNSLYRGLEQPYDNSNLDFMRKSLGDFGDTVKLDTIIK